MTSQIRHALRIPPVPMDDETVQLRRRHPERASNGNDVANMGLKGWGDDMVETELPVRTSTAPPCGRNASCKLPEGSMIKHVGWNVLDTASETGTSQEGVLCSTSGMASCLGAALAGYTSVPAGFDPHQFPNVNVEAANRRPKVRVFHAFDLAEEVGDQIDEAVAKMHRDGLYVVAALRGSDDAETSVSMLETVTDVLAQRKVPVAFSLTPDPFMPLGPLGGIIHQGRPHLVDDVVMTAPGTPIEVGMLPMAEQPGSPIDHPPTRSRKRQVRETTAADEEASPPRKKPS